MTNLRSMPLSREELSELLSYDPDTGVFRWKGAAGRRVKVGAEAGQIKQTRPGGPQYRYIGIKGIQAPAARLAWLMHYGEWPVTNVQFKDDDTLNVAIENLTLAKFGAVKGELGDRKVYKMSREAQRHYGLKRYYGLSIQQYSEKFLAQGGVCAICEKPETVMTGDEVRPLSVDHNHTTNAVRGLLCNACNHLLGHAFDDRKVLLAAVRYLDEYEGREPVKVDLTVVEKP